MAKTFKNFIAGKWVAPQTGRYIVNRNPADTTDVIGRFPDSGPADVAAAVASAKRGFEQWSRTPAPLRGDAPSAASATSSRTARKSSPMR